MTPPEAPAPIPVTAAVLAGGRSMRMGVDKTLLHVDGVPLVSRVVEAVSSVCSHVTVVTNRPDSLADAGLPEGVSVLTDEVAYLGPLGGLVTAMGAATDEWVLAVAADLPWLSTGLIRALWELRDGADVVVPVTAEGAEPLLALYRVEACLPAARAAIESGRRRLVAFFGAVKVLEVPIESLRDSDPDLRSFLNVNTPSDLAEARDAAEHRLEPAKSPRDADIRLSVIEIGPARGRGMPSERPVTVYMNDVEVATVQATPKDLEEMAVGFLVSEGLLTDRDALGSVEADVKRGLAYVTTAESVPEDMVFKTRYITSGCGKGVTFSSLGHARGLDPITSTMQVSPEQAYSLMGDLSRAAEKYRDTGGIHACGLARDGQLQIAREDVGRHNAFDKLLGRAWLDRMPTDDAVLLSTGRISYEMAVKAAKSRVPIVVSRTAVTDLAAEIAAELGITLIGYVRRGRMTVYTHPHRLLTAEEA